VNQEIEWFLQTANEADDRVLTLLVDGNPEGAVPKTITKIDNLRVDVRADKPGASASTLARDRDLQTTRNASGRSVRHTISP
jgi:hypothetical protein